MYGIDLQLRPDDVVSDQELPKSVLYEVNQPFSEIDLAVINDNKHELDTDQYLFVANESALSESLGGDDQTGINLYSTSGQVASLPPGVDFRGIAIFTENMRRSARSSAVIRAANQPDALTTSPVGLVATKTTIHEFGHSLQTGEADDDCLRRPQLEGEIYSGEENLITGDNIDPTPEQLTGTKLWSIMISGWDDDLLISPMNGRYLAYSVEELSTIKTGSDLPCVG